MSQRSERAWKMLTLGLGVILLFQVTRIALRSRPLAHVKMPEVPVWVDTNAPVISKSSNTFTSLGGSKTNPAISLSATNKGSNAALLNPALIKTGTPPIAVSGATNIEISLKAGQTNPAVLAQSKTNSATNSITAAGAPVRSGPGQSNSVAKVESDARGTNSPPRTPPPRMAMNPFGQPGHAGGPDVPPEVKARIDRIVDSEIFAPVVRPLPLALLGIAGNVAFLRTPNGQTGMIKEQEELGGVKLLRIGTNRVLVQEDGQEKELTIFAGMGGESLLPKPKDNTR